MTSAIGSWSNWTEDVIIMPRVQPRICRTTEARSVALAEHINVLWSFTCKYRLFSQHLINVSGGLLMCKWVKVLLPPCRRNVCTEAQSCLRRRDSQISRCGAKPVALSTREPLRVFNSLSFPLPPLPLCADETCVWMCVFACVFMRVHYLPKSLHVYSFVPFSNKFTQCLSSQWIAMGVREKLGRKMWETSRYWYRA